MHQDAGGEEGVFVMSFYTDYPILPFSPPKTFINLALFEINHTLCPLEKHTHFSFFIYPSPHPYSPFPET
jgi:hypothetical protein